ncbi:amino acid adenylation domain protein [Fibrisoma limi BUZ 3]|uniref:Amino acid adenylation domain protein n=1 Tax=Fibrisoma limi BUZ 3 TaxID=1185876 RepID=I2GT88_9BACT|nr:type I polyketide synthase [Fibrisoma limi]CCH57117.1 amino acid adenylation domain protein [Fibrisoma limi BUZ 3]
MIDFIQNDTLGGQTSMSLLVHQLFNLQVSSAPDAIAVLDDQQRISFRELNQRASQLAGSLLERGVKKEDIVGVCLNQSVEMVTAVLAILKAGCAFVPIDPSHPAERISFIIQDTATKILLTNSTYYPALHPYSREFSSVSVINIDYQQTDFYSKAPSTPDVEVGPADLAYVIYTSGSTGKPKGVLVEHRSIASYIQNSIQAYTSNEAIHSTYAHLTLSFDASLTALFVPLATGKTMVINRAKALDAFDNEAFVNGASYDFLKLTPAQLFLLDKAKDEQAKFAARKIVVGGEALYPRHYQFLADSGAEVEIINEYGPTEAAVGCITYTFAASANVPVFQNGLLIGKPMPNVSIYILDENQQLVAVGERGEIYIGGVQVARGYLNRDDLTRERFLPDPFSGQPGARMYKSGDAGRRHPDGNIEYLGRIDEQVKIQGYRIELGEIENVLLQHPDIVQCAVSVVDNEMLEKRLAAYYVGRTADLERSDLVKFLSSRLPAYMVPALWTKLDSLPLSVNGKVNRQLLPKPESKRSALNTPYLAPVTATEKKIAIIWASVLGFDKVGLTDNFFELGGTSLLSVQCVALIKQECRVDISATKLFQYPTIKALGAFLDQAKGSKKSKKSARPSTRQVNRDVAVIGMAGRFPGANTIDELWAVLSQGKETVRFFGESDIDRSVPASLRNDPAYVGARGVLDQADQFDAAFFGIPPRVAELMDPQQRIFLEIAWEVLEQTGYLPGQYDGKVGVYAGCGNNTYYIHNVLPNRELVGRLGDFQVMSLNEKDYIASRTAYQLNLTGPAVSVYSACSTSLLAITQAVDSIRLGHCDLALAGGASVTSPVNSGHLYQEGAMMSRDGHTRSFDAAGTGTVFSDGAGVVLLKSAEAARRDGDRIFAIIKGVGVNNDGGGKGSFLAPNAEGQAGAIRNAMEDAAVAPASVQYVEAHGTATPLGDPIEIEGLKLAFGPQTESQYCALGSIKSNIGHLTQAAGVAGFIKATLALYYRQIPPSLGYDKPNPAIDFADSPFYVNTKLTEWESTSVRRAGVSSFGVGGTNVHVVLEEAASTIPESGPGRPFELITWSARSAASQDAYAYVLADHLGGQMQHQLADVAYTLQTTRPDFTYRRFVIAATSSELIDALLADNSSVMQAKRLEETPDEVVFMFPGQGSQYLTMGRELYLNERTYRQAVDECAKLLEAYLETDIREVLFPKENNPAAEERLKNTRYTQPALFVTEYALARLWESWGVRPSIYCGHSIGEFVAAHLAGVFTLADALRLIATRGRLVSQLPRGSMLSVRKEAEQVKAIMPASLSMAAINSPSLCVVAGRDEDVATFAMQLDKLEIPNQVLQTSHAFHSDMMEPIVSEFADIVRQIPLSQPQTPIVSTVTGTWLTSAEATDPAYWANHLRVTVRFSDALHTLMQRKPVLLEVGPGHVTTVLARQQAGARQDYVLTSLEPRRAYTSEYQSILKALGQLWLHGIEPDWKAFYADQNRNRLRLPTYAFDRKRCWVDPLPVASPPIPEPIISVKTQETKLIESSYTYPPQQPMRKDVLITKVKEILENASGIELDGVTPDMSFLEIGFDSLLLTQIAITLKKEFKLPITFRQLNGEYATLHLLTDYLDRQLPADAYAPQPTTQPVQPALAPVAVNAPVAAPVMPTAPPVMLPDGNDSALGLIAQQLQILARQVALLQGGQPAMPVPVPAAPVPAPVPVVQSAKKPEITAVKNGSGLTPEEVAELKKPFGATARIERQATELTTRQQTFLQELIDTYTQKTAGSKAFTQEHRAHMADPRVVSGFKPLTKEIVYPVVVNKSKGSRLWDVDGNEYIDALNGFGSNMLGYQADVIREALHQQIENGFEVGPQHELAGDVCKLVCEFTGFDRTALCNTGSEAVLGAMRIARTVTGRSLIVAFSGSYHGIVDEVIVRGTRQLKSFPAASGIMPESVQNMLILDYGTPESLAIIKERADDIAAVLVEPVQSRRPEFVPIDFLKQVRTVTAESGIALIFDEVISGFRMHPGGAQALFGIKADLASYGKVVGGGLSIGVISGKKEFMDALDGGYWQFGDPSVPEVGVTYFAGTFVRHPLALAAAQASLRYMKAKGPALQKGLTDKAAFLAGMLNAHFTRYQLPMFVAQFGSLWKLKFTEEIPYSELLFTLMRQKGIHILDGFPCFMTEAHTPEEVSLIGQTMIESVDELVEAGFFKATPPTEEPIERRPSHHVFSVPPVLGARLGMDKKGNPAWFVPNPDQPGHYLQIELN